MEQHSMEHRVHLINGEVVIVRGAVIVKDEESAYLTFETENALYRFRWSSILYYVSRRRGTFPSPASSSAPPSAD